MIVPHFYPFLPLGGPQYQTPAHLNTFRNMFYRVLHPWGVGVPKLPPKPTRCPCPSVNILPYICRLNNELAAARPECVFVCIKKVELTIPHSSSFIARVFHLHLQPQPPPPPPNIQKQSNIQKCNLCPWTLVVATRYHAWPTGGGTQNSPFQRILGFLEGQNRPP